MNHIGQQKVKKLHKMNISNIKVFGLKLLSKINQRINSCIWQNSVGKHQSQIIIFVFISERTNFNIDQLLTLFQVYKHSTRKFILYSPLAVRYSKTLRVSTSIGS